MVIVEPDRLIVGVPLNLLVTMEYTKFAVDGEELNVIVRIPLVGTA